MTGFLDVPLEVQAQILGYLSMEMLVRLRLVCAALRAAVDGTRRCIDRVIIRQESACIRWRRSNYHLRHRYISEPDQYERLRDISPIMRPSVLVFRDLFPYKMQVPDSLFHPGLRAVIIKQVVLDDRVFLQKLKQLLQQILSFPLHPEFTLTLKNLPSFVLGGTDIAWVFENLPQRIYKLQIKVSRIKKMREVMRRVALGYEQESPVVEHGLNPAHIAWVWEFANYALRFGIDSSVVHLEITPPTPENIDFDYWDLPAVEFVNSRRSVQATLIRLQGRWDVELIRQPAGSFQDLLMSFIRGWIGNPPGRPFTFRHFAAPTYPSLHRVCELLRQIGVDMQLPPNTVNVSIIDDDTLDASYLLPHSPLCIVLK